MSTSIRIQPQTKAKTKGGYTRQRRGCLTCRQRKKKCDQGFPICGHCSRLNLVCEREAPRRVQSAARSHFTDRQLESAHAARRARNRDCNHGHEVWRLTEICGPLDLMRFGDADDFGDLGSNRRAMMRYYTATLVFMLTTNIENNCFLSVLLPMAFDCPPLVDVLVAWLSAHLALRSPEFRHISLVHRGQALAKIGSLLQEESLSGEMCLAAAMAMCSMDSISDGTSGWTLHLSGAAGTIQSKQILTSPAPRDRSTMLRSSEGKWLLRNFAYHDVLMSVSLNRRPLLAGDYWVSTDDTLADPYFGFASRILFLISEISVLNAGHTENKMPYDDDSGWGSEARYSGHEAYWDRAHQIEKELQEWSCPCAVAESPVALLSEAYRNAALIYLNRSTRRHFPEAAVTSQSQAGDNVSSICHIATKMPEGSLAECTFLFPLFMAGGEAVEAGHIGTIRDRLCTMNKWRKFRNVEACLEVLEEVWMGESEGLSGLANSDNLDWQDVVTRRGWQLALS